MLGVKSAIVVGPRWSDLHEDTALLPLDHLIIKLSDLRLDTEYDSDTTTEHQLQRYLSDKVSVSDKSREAALLHHQTRDTNSLFPQKEEENRQFDCQTSQQAHNVVKFCFHQLVANVDSHCVNHITCDAEYVVNSPYMGKAETVNVQTDCPVICETDYIPNIAVLT